MDPRAHPVCRQVRWVTSPVLARVGRGEGSCKDLSGGVFQPPTVVGSIANAAGRAACGQEGGKACASQGFWHLMERCLSGMLDPVAIEVVASCHVQFVESTLHAGGKQATDICVAGEGHMGARIPHESVSSVHPNVPVRPVALLEHEAVLMAKMVRAGSPGKARTQNQDHEPPSLRRCSTILRRQSLAEPREVRRAIPLLSNRTRACSSTPAFEPPGHQTMHMPSRQSVARTA